MLRSLILATVSFALAAQTPTPAAAPKPAQAAQKPAPVGAPKPAEAAKPKEDKVLATIGKDVVRESDFDLFLKISMTEQQRMQVMMMPGGKDQYLKRFIEYRVLAAKAKKEGIQKDPEFAKKMKLMEMQVLIQTLFDRDGAKLKERTTITDADVKAYFDKHPEKFQTPETFSARHILVSTRPQGKDNKARTEEEALAKIKEIQTALKAGKTFEEAAKEFSEDPGSKDKGGLYENMAFGRFVPEFDKAVRAQELGKVGEPVKSMHGYHLIQVEKLTPATPQTFEAAKEAAKQQATAERQESVMTNYMNEAKQETDFKEGAAATKAPATPKSTKGAK